MNRATVAKLAVSSLALGLTMVGCTPQGAGGGGIASASDRSDARTAKSSAKLIQRAEAAMAKKDYVDAVAFAEAAVAAQPDIASHRVLLGDAYFGAGRFASAQSAFADALTLDASLGRAALSLALAQVATGNQEGARATLTANAERIPGGDRGLALALAGDAKGAVEILSDAARATDATAKTRQNLALALALADRWQEARIVVGQDLPSAEADQRIIEWAAFAKPQGAADQIAALTGVTPAAADAGLPVHLALRDAAPAEAPVMTAAVESAPAAAPEPVAAPVALAAVETAPQPVAQVQPALAAAARAVEMASVVFLPMKEVVQVVPADYVEGGKRPVPLLFAKRGPAKVRHVEQAANGRYTVQLGAFENAAIAEDAWGRVSRRHRVLASYTPANAPVPTGGWGSTRLSVGRFASEAEARKLCGLLRGQGQRCFVRAVAGDVAVRATDASQRFAAL